MTLITDYYALRPGDYGPIASLEFFQVATDSGGVEQGVRLTLAKAPDLAGPQLRLLFHGVTKLEFRQPEWSLASLGLMEIHERDTGFIVTEEEGQLRLACRSFEASSAGS
jgi:hypothetical protein